ncbi:MAG: hypothetical protein AB1716_05455 [Planctomycetota bacterium]
MTTSPSEPTRTTTTLPDARNPPNRALRLLLVLAAGGCALLVSNNWCFVLLPAAGAAWLADHVVCALRPRLALRAAVAIVVGCAAGVALNVRPAWAFREAFGVEQLPAGVREVRVQRHYLGGPGEHALIVEFTADEATLRSLLKLRPHDPDSYKVQQWRATGGGWLPAFDAFVGPAATTLARRSWSRIRPLQAPEVFDFDATTELRSRLVLFYEPPSGRCVALQVRH